MFRVTPRKFWITSFHGNSLLNITAFLLTLAKWNVAFNIDLATVLIHHASPNTHFGFSVSLHRTQGKSWLLIGSPTAKTTQPTVTKGGAVYKCGINKSNNCQQITFDTSGSGEIITESKREYTENKSHQWFGATVYSAGENGPVVACAPRYVYFSNSLKRRDPVGTCWTARSSLSGFKEYSPCRTSAWGYHRQGSCQAGLSAAISKNGRWLYIGAVGSWYWQGQVFSQDLLAKQYLYSTSEAPQSEDDSYLGYSAAVGEFTGDDDPDLAVGMPRGHELNGKVLLFTTILKNIQNLTGEQLGAYFGYAICVADVDGNRLDDVIVGAPLYSDFTSKSRSYEEGRVYIFFQTAEHQMKNRSYLDGTYTKGRFGMALSSLGDIDRDGYQDFAVGAPYAGEKDRGIVYIFRGSRNGIKSIKPSQIIRAEDIGDTGLSTFGFSLSGGMDMDENQYPDLLVGAYESNRAIFFRSRPVVNLFLNLMIDPNSINLDEQICSLSDGTGVSCVVVSVCLQYNGTSVPSELHVLFKTRLDIGLEQSPRVFFLDREKISHSNYQVSLRKGSVFCKSVYAYIQEQVRDKLTPIIIEVATELRDLEPSRKMLKPILNEDLPRILMEQVNIQKNCGKDNMCIPDLTVEMKANMDEYLIGSRKKLELTVNITNRGEDAFESMLYLETPQDFSYVNINKTSASITVSCFPYLRTPEVNNIVCDIGNPFPAGHELIFSVILKPARVASRIPYFHFKMKVNSTNSENFTLGDNQRIFELPVTFKIKMDLHGISIPERITYNKSTILPESQIQAEDDIGPEVVHVYEIINKGPSTIQQAEVHILWPAYTLYGRHLLYLVDQPKVKGKAHCQDVPEVNTLFLKKVSRKSMESEALLQDSEADNVINITHLEEENLSKERNKRQQDVADAFLNDVKCGPNMCTRIYCTLFNLNENDQVLFTIRSRLWVSTIEEIGLSHVQVSSKLVTRVLELPYDVRPVSVAHKVYMVTTKVHPDYVKQQKVFLRWIIIAIPGGLLLLSLLVWSLMKVGFFERKRPPEKQPLHSSDDENGYVYNGGDETL